MSEPTYNNAAFVGQMFFERGTDDSPPQYDRVCQVFSIGGVGESNELIDATTFCSLGSREYIGGLADGSEITLEGNYEKGNNILQQIIADVKARRVGPVRVVVGTDSPQEALVFDALALAWTINPSVDNRNTISFTYKITGPVEIEYL
jgi:hypothetical protein